MGRAIAALFAAALIYPSIIFALGLHKALGDPARVGIVLFATVLILGFPALITCCKRKWWGAGRIVGGGVLGGALSAVPFAGGNFHFVWLVLAFALIGMLVAVPFWFAAIWRNDNLTCPRKFCLPCGQAYRYARNVLRRPAVERS